MTIGQRIAQKRKELRLSQEGLGERLGVSRQSIYKWESDTSLPEIDKLVAMSRLFGVTVGGLLGVETEPAGREEGEKPEEAAEEQELTEQQLKMVEEIVERYLAAQPKPVPPRRRRLLKAAVAAAGIFLAYTLLNISGQLDRIQSNYDDLQNTVSNVSSSVDRQIGNITSRVEAVLKAQNSLLADYSVGDPAVDSPGGTVIFPVSVTPKTYTPGMAVTFTADTEEGLTATAGALEAGQTFTASLTCPLTDSITLSVVLTTGETRETQLLDSCQGLLSSTYPNVSLRAAILNDIRLGEDGGAESTQPNYVPVAAHAKSVLAADIAQIQVGLFYEKTLLAWAEPCERPQGFSEGFADHRFFRIPAMALPGGGAEGFYTVAALVTDIYGRQFLTCGSGYCFNENGVLEDIVWLDSGERERFYADYGANYEACGPLEGWDIAA